MKRILIFGSMLSAAFLSAQNYYGTELIGESGINSVSKLNRVGNKIILSGFVGGNITGNFPIAFKGGNADGIITSISATDGAIQWVKQFGGGFDEVVTDATIDGEGNYYVTGYFMGAGATYGLDADPGPGVYTLSVPSAIANRDIFIVKLNSTGDFVWAKQISTPTGAGNDDATVIKTDSAGNVYVAGSYVSADFDPGPGTDVHTIASGSGNGFIVKLTSQGDLTWVKTLDGSSSKKINNMVIDAQDNLYVVGHFQGNIDLNPDPTATDIKTTAGNFDTFVAKYDSSGSYLWGQSYGGTGSDTASKIYLNGNNLYTGGWFSNTVDLDPSAGTNSFTSTGGSDAYVSKFNTDGIYVSSYVIADSSTGSNEIRDIVADGSGNLYLSGTFQSSVIGANSYTSAGAADNFYLKLDPTMNFSGIYIVGGTQGQGSPLIQPLTGTKFVGVGTSSGTADFDYTANTSAVTGTTASTYTYITKFDFETTMLGVSDIDKKFDFSVYPIPAKDDLNIRSERKIKSASVFSMDGKRVYNIEKQDIKNVNVSMLPTGTYFLQVKDEKGNINQTKFIKN
ncbi:hypothetical protein J3D55_004036 [Chryseobacterium ginsenosidimutans]|uniref:T9SS type A sorting domain-containing protein n=1 Tax=Chryseobacterium ginsenosidimutans TaxID=687846 RepID=UPI0021698BC3|nr:T9SS type A sorting domain-containing protein [Chryseobacterium ginsenosidimutans]MCS3871120.1 hypothetical protein [Chryseobacterium ginsenosidimutans]